MKSVSRNRGGPTAADCRMLAPITRPFQRLLALPASEAHRERVIGALRGKVCTFDFRMAEDTIRARMGALTGHSRALPVQRRPGRDSPRSVRVDVVFVLCKLVEIPVDIVLPIPCSLQYSVRLPMVLLSMPFLSGMPWRTCDMQRGATFSQRNLLKRPCAHASPGTLKGVWYVLGDLKGWQEGEILMGVAFSLPQGLELVLPQPYSTPCRGASPS